MNPKILSRRKLFEIGELLKKRGQKIVVVNGSFDIMHAGHLKFFRQAKHWGDVLVVLVNSDQSVKKYKGPNRPIIGEKDRLAMVAAIADVDYVALFDELEPKEIIARIKPAIYCNGSDWGKYCVERPAVEAGGGRVVIIKRQKNALSSSAIIKRIVAIYSRPPVRAVFIDRDGTINDNKDGYVHKIKDFAYLPGVISALKKLSLTDYKIIIVTNQSGIGRGYYHKSDYDKLTKFMLADFRRRGIRMDKVYFCPHRSDEGCVCRKPRVGMLLSAVKDFGISLNDSWLIGDDDKDAIMGREANIKTIKLGKINRQIPVRPNFVVKDLAAAAGIILNNGK